MYPSKSPDGARNSSGGPTGTAARGSHGYTDEPRGGGRNSGLGALDECGAGAGSGLCRMNRLTMAMMDNLAVVTGRGWRP